MNNENQKVPILKIEKINKFYGTKNEKLHIIQDLDFEVNEVDFISILGKSGSGKTTLLNLIGMLDNVDTGDIIYNGINISKINEKERNNLRNKYLGFVFQFHYLLPEFSALENVMIPALVQKDVNKVEVEKRAKELLDEMGLSERLTHKPSELSGGEKQRVAIARALINSPKLLIADEPTGNLDDETSASIHELLRRINKEKGQTILVVTHSTELAGITSKKMILKRGKLQVAE